jgi:hypothetical protein
VKPVSRAEACDDGEVTGNRLCTLGSGNDPAGYGGRRRNGGCR